MQEDDAPHAEGDSFGTLPLDVLYKMFVDSGFTVQELKTFCSVNQKIRKACGAEYPWLKLYFIKVIGDRRLPTLRERPLDDGDSRTEAQRYVYDTLMDTTAGREWSQQRASAASPYVLLIAFAYKYLLTRRAPGMLPSAGSNGYLYWTDGKQGLEMHGSRNALYIDLRGPEEVRRLFGVAGYEVPIEEIVPMFCQMLERNWIPDAVSKGNKKHQNRMLTKSCLSCSAMPAILVQCGGRCGRAFYCGQLCANADWQMHELECKSKK